MLILEGANQDQDPMEFNLSFSIFIHLIAAFLSMLIAVILWTYPGERPYPYRKLLSAFFGVLALAIGISFANASGITLQMPHLYRTGNIFGLLFMPFSYLYVRSIVRERPPSRPDLLHALPAVFYIVDFWPFFMLSADQKLEIYRQTLGNPNILLSFSEGRFTPVYFHLAARSIQFFIYWALQVWLLARLAKLEDFRGFFRANREWVRFITIFLVLQFFFSFPILLALLLGSRQSLWLTSEVAGTSMVVFMSLVLFFRPQMLYGIQGLLQFSKKEETTDKSELPAYLEVQAVRELEKRLNDLMEREKLYLHSDYSLRKLSNDLDIPAYKLSAFLNKAIGSNFNEYINQHRIEYCLRKMKAGDWDHLTLQAIAEECGFNNRNTFTGAFKKHTRMTPSEYLKQVDKVD